MRVACATFRSFTDWLCVIAKKHKRLLQFAMIGESDYLGDWRLPRFARNDVLCGLLFGRFVNRPYKRTNGSWLLTLVKAQHIGSNVTLVRRRTPFLLSLRETSVTKQSYKIGLCHTPSVTYGDTFPKGEGLLVIRLWSKDWVYYVIVGAIHESPTY